MMPLISQPNNPELTRFLPGNKETYRVTKMRAHALNHARSVIPNPRRSYPANVI